MQAASYRLERRPSERRWPSFGPGLGGGKAENELDSPHPVQMQTSFRPGSSLLQPFPSPSSIHHLQPPLLAVPPLGGLGNPDTGQQRLCLHLRSPPGAGERRLRGGWRGWGSRGGGLGGRGEGSLQGEVLLLVQSLIRGVQRLTSDLRLGP